MRRLHQNTRAGHLRHVSLTAGFLLVLPVLGCQGEAAAETSAAEQPLTLHDLKLIGDLRGELVSRDTFEPWFVCRAGRDKDGISFVVAQDLRVSARFRKLDFNGSPVDAEVPVGVAKLTSTGTAPRIFEFAFAEQKLVMTTPGPGNVARLVRGPSATSLACEELDAPYRP